MDQSVGQFLDAYCPEDRKGQYVRVDELMATFGLEDYSSSFITLVNDAEMYDTSEIMDRFHLKVTHETYQLLFSHGVTMNDDATLFSHIAVLNALDLLQMWTDHGQILALLEMDSTTEEIFAELVGLTTGADIETIMECIDEVDPSLLTSIEQLHANAEDEQDPVAGSPELVASVVAVKTFIGDKSEYAMRILKAGYPLGAPIAFYVNVMKRYWSTLTVEQVSNELFVILHMAEDSYRNIITGYASISSKIFDQLDTISAVDLRIKKLLSEFTSHKLHQGN